MFTFIILLIIYLLPADETAVHLSMTLYPSSLEHVVNAMHSNFEQYSYRHLSTTWGICSHFVIGIPHTRWHCVIRLLGCLQLERA